MRPVGVEQRAAHEALVAVRIVVRRVIWAVVVAYVLVVHVFRFVPGALVSAHDAVVVAVHILAVRETPVFSFLVVGRACFAAVPVAQVAARDAELLAGRRAVRVADELAILPEGSLRTAVDALRRAVFPEVKPRVAAVVVADVSVLYRVMVVVLRVFAGPVAHVVAVFVEVPERTVIVARVASVHVIWLCARTLVVTRELLRHVVLVIPDALRDALLAVLVVVHLVRALFQTGGRVLDVEFVSGLAAVVVADVFSRDAVVGPRAGTVLEALVLAVRVIPGAAAAGLEADLRPARVVPESVRGVRAVLVAEIPVLLVELGRRRALREAGELVRKVVDRRRPALAHAEHGVVVIVLVRYTVLAHQVARVLVLDVVLRGCLGALCEAEELVLHVVLVVRAVGAGVVAHVVSVDVVQIRGWRARWVTRDLVHPVVPVARGTLFVANLLAFYIILFGIRALVYAVICVVYVKFVIRRVRAARIALVLAVYKELVASVVARGEAYGIVVPVPPPGGTVAVAYFLPIVVERRQATAVAYAGERPVDVVRVVVRLRAVVVALLAPGDPVAVPGGRARRITHVTVVPMYSVRIAV